MKGQNTEPACQELVLACLHFQAAMVVGRMAYHRQRTCLTLPVGLTAICGGRIDQGLVSTVLSLSLVVLACTVPPLDAFNEIPHS